MSRTRRATLGAGQRGRLGTLSRWQHATASGRLARFKDHRAHEVRGSLLLGRSLTRLIGDVPPHVCLTIHTLFVSSLVGRNVHAPTACPNFMEAVLCRPSTPRWPGHCTAMTEQVGTVERLPPPRPDQFEAGPGGAATTRESGATLTRPGPEPGGCTESMSSTRLRRRVGLAGRLGLAVIHRRFVIRVEVARRSQRGAA